MGLEVFPMNPDVPSPPDTDKRDQTEQHDLPKDRKRGTGDKSGESADSIRHHLARGRLGPPSEGRQT